MSASLAERVVNTFHLTEKQRLSALERGRNVVVTAGAGSGKTRTLVARYASLLADGLSPRQVTAITFTEKAAREMRSRLRMALNDLIATAKSKKEHEYWAGLNAQMDAARIGTIHSLCAEILRSHPAEAGVDPRFEVLDEGLAAALKKQTVDESLKQMVSDVQYKPLLQALGTDGMQDLLKILLNRRLEAREIFANAKDSDQIVRKHLEETLNLPAFATPLCDLRAFSQTNLLADAGDKLAAQVSGLLQEWEQSESALGKGEIIKSAQHLFTARRKYLKKGTGKKNSAAKDMVALLQEAYDQHLNPLIGGADSKNAAPDEETELLFKQIYPLIYKSSEEIQRLYQAQLRQRYALDFDDLEYGAMQLLQRQDIRANWQNEIQALLVDEFQDTNPRQREIVQLLAEDTGRYFVVGDARQSIYRFRRADVTVFREVQDQTQKNGGLVLDLDITYRAHEPLLNAMGDLLASVMGQEDDPKRPYHVPFTPLDAHRKTAPEYISDPHIEFVFGTGEDAAETRPIAARALAQRLLDLKEKNQIRTWDDVALLFRASTGYAFYENAFEDAGIPFVTVSGRGFYDRPEIRDMLNLLRALADPADDLALAGLLRSPAFGLTDSALYRLRIQEEKPTPYWEALQGDLSCLDEEDATRAKRAVEIMRKLQPQVDQSPVAELLKAVVDAVDYRAILAADDERGANGRLWRNLDKLISDAQTSGMVNVRDFLEYLSTLNDAGAREGESPADAQGAVRLMTIHKSKGLEFSVVALADAARTPRNAGDSVYLLPQMGFSVKVGAGPMIHRLSKQLDADQNNAESGRLLYVALTRAQNKLIISGHVTSGRSVSTAGWMKDLCKSLNLDLNKLVTDAGTFSTHKTQSGHSVLAWCAKTEESLPPFIRKEEPKLIEPKAQALYQPFSEAQPIFTQEDEQPSPRIWRATEKTLHVPATVIGQMTHKAIELRLSADDPRLISLLESLALESGLAMQEQRVEAVRRTHKLIKRFYAHPLRTEIDSANQVRHEVPYFRTHKNHTETGYIDLLYRKGAVWYVVDFKTDSIRSAAERDTLLAQYVRQISRYANAVQAFLGQTPQRRICFLDDEEKVSVVEV